jgi:hypothetical protein
LARANGTKYFITACAASVPAREILERQSKPMAQLRQQPRLIEDIFARAAHPTLEQQRLDFRHRPPGRPHGVARQALQCPHPLVAVDEDKSLGFADHDDGQLLADFGQGADECAFGHGGALADTRVAQLQLMQF